MDWARYLKEYFNSDLWGFVLLDYYHNRKKEQKEHESPSHFIDNVLSNLPKTEVDPVAFHKVLLCVCVQLLGNDFPDIMGKSISVIKDLTKPLNDEQLRLIISHYKVYRQNEIFIRKLVDSGILAKSVEDRVMTPKKNLPISESSDILIESNQAKLSEAVSTVPKEILDISNIKGKVDIGIITIREDEFSAVLKRFKDRNPVTGGKNFYDFSRISAKSEKELGVVITRIIERGQGKAQAIARNMIEELSPPWIFLVGISGGIPDNEYSLGDVVCASRFLNFAVTTALQDKNPQMNIDGGDFHTDVEKLLSHLKAFDDNNYFRGWNSKESIELSKPRIKIPEDLKAGEFYGSDDWRNKVKSSLKRNFPKNKKLREPCFHVGLTASSNTMNKDADLTERWLDSAKDIKNVEMELDGVYQAARYGGNQNYRILAIRGLSDIIGFKRDPEWTEYACNSAASFAYTLIKSGVLELLGLVTSTQPNHLIR